MSWKVELWVEETQAVGRSNLVGRVGGWVGGWVGDVPRGELAELLLVVLALAGKTAHVLDVPYVHLGLGKVGGWVGGWVVNLDCFE